ncbi:MAG: hypothetical protein WC708_12745 [Lentisphaeria bacterium]
MIFTATAREAVPDGAVFFPGQPPFGVNIHTPGHGPKISALGARWVRWGVSWADVEKQPGVYDFSRADVIVADFQKNKLNILNCIGLHDLNPVRPDPRQDLPGYLAALTAFTRATAAHYRGRVGVWEIGNEPETCMAEVFNNPETYVRIARTLAKAIREADPTAHVGALSVAWMDRPFITRCLELGLLADGTIDILTFHGYHRANLMPESGLAADVAWLRAQAAAHAPPGKRVIVIDSERGYAIHPFLTPKPWDNWRNIVYSETEQAAYLARHYLEEIHLGIEISIWYKDMWGEANFSLYEGGPDSRLRPMGVAMRNLAAQLPDNPKEMANARYAVTVAPASTVEMRSFRVRPRGAGRTERLVVALWNPVEAFDGKFLQSRQKIGDSFYEAWRALSPEDRVAIPVQVAITGLPARRVRSCQLYNLLDTDGKTLKKPLVLTAAGGRLTTESLPAGPMPALLVFDLAPE